LHEKAKYAAGFLGVHEVLTNLKHATSATTRVFHKHASKALMSIANVAQKAALDQSQRSKDSYDRRSAYRQELSAISETKNTALAQLHSMHHVVESTMSHLTDVHAMKQDDPTGHTSYADSGHDDDIKESDVPERAKAFANKLHTLARTRARNNSEYGDEHASIRAGFDSLVLEPVGDIHDDEHTVAGKLQLPNFHVMHSAGVDRDDAELLMNVCMQAIYNAHHGHLTMSMMTMWSMLTAIQSQIILLLGLQHSKFEFVDKYGFDRVIHMALNAHEPPPDYNSSNYKPLTNTVYDYMSDNTSFSPNSSAMDRMPSMPSMPRAVNSSFLSTVETPIDKPNPYIFPGA
jgi:hypothetical protein